MNELKETDETLRLGLPALRARGSWTNRLILLGGGLAVAALLVIAIVQILQFDRVPLERQLGTRIASEIEAGAPRRRVRYERGQGCSANAGQRPGREPANQ